MEEFKIPDLTINTDALQQSIESIKETLSSFTMGPSYITMYHGKEPTTLSVEHTVSWSLLHDDDPAAVEEYIRNELARKIAKKLIEEDLLLIQTSDDPATMDRTVRATVKLLQE